MPSQRLLTAAIALIACLSAAVGLYAQTATPYNPALERQLWKQLLPWGVNTGPNGETIWADRHDLNNPPSTGSVVDTGDIDEYLDPIYQSIGPFGSPDYPSMDAAQVEFGRLVNQGECTFSHAADYDLHWSIFWPQVRLCKGPQVSPGVFAQLPPAPGRLLNPVGLAASGKKIFVADLFNHRIQVFDFFGNNIPMKYPIGNGIPGNGSYNYDTQYPSLHYRPYANVPGYATFDGGYSGYQLSGPAGIAVDSRKVGGVESPRLLVADKYNGRVALFNDDGSPAFLNGSTPVHVPMSIPRDANGVPIQTEDPDHAFAPDQISISDGAIIRDPSLHAPIASNDPDFLKRIVVTDHLHCYVAIMDVGFNLIKTLPSTLPAGTQHDACQESQGGQFPLQPGEFTTISGVKVDKDGTIYIVDTSANVVRVFDRNGNLIASVGEVGGTNPGGQGTLLNPVGVFIDDKFNRLGVIDAGHARAVFYSLANGPTAVTFQFQIDTTVSNDDNAMGVLMQFGAKADGLDPKGRIMVTDPIRRRVLRWELPELIIANAAADITNPSANPKTGLGSFDVVVPYQKLSPVNSVIVDVQPQVPASVHIVPGSVSPSLSLRPNIANGSLIHYTFQFTSTIDEAKFDITARGDCDTQGANCLAKAPQAAAVARALCGTCSASNKVYFESEDLDNPDPASTIATPPAKVDTDTGRSISAWYNRPVFVRITPTNPAGTSPTDPNRVVAIGWTYGGASDTNYEQTLTEVPIPDGGYLDVPVGITGVSWVTYRAITLSGAASAPVEVLLPVDMNPPSMQFTSWTPRTGVDGNLDWYNVPVTGTYKLVDGHSGPQVAGSTVSFTSEGRGQFTAFPMVDRVGNEDAARSDDTARLGKPVNIDMVPPTFGSTALTFELAANATDSIGDYVDIAANRFTVAVTDPLLADGTPGSGALTPGVGNQAALKVRNGDQIYFEAVDHAGNHSTAFARITVTKRPILSATVTVTGGTFTYDGLGHPATACIVHGDNETFAGTLTYYPVNAVPVNASTVTATCSFDGNARYAGATPATATITINKATPTVTTTGGVFTYDGLVHSSVCTVTGINNTPLTPFTVTYNGGNVAPINAAATAVPVLCSYAGSANYNAKTGTNSITINKRPITITTPSKTINLGDAVPSFPYTLAAGSLPLVGTDVLTGTLGLPASLPVGVYSLTIGTVTAGSNYTVTLLPATLTVVALNLPPVAVNDSKSSVGAAPVTIPVLTNDSDPDGAQSSLTITSFGQPAAGAAAGVVTQSGTQLVFTPAVNFVGTVTFPYVISDGRGGTATATVTVTITQGGCTTSGFTTYTQGGWGASPNGNNPAALLASKFAQVYPSGYVRIGGTKTLTFTSATAVHAFLPAGGTAAMLNASATNPTYSSAGVLAGQVLALQLNVDFSNAGVTKPGLGDLLYQGYPVSVVLDAANQVLGGNTSVLDAVGLNISDLNAIVDSINNNFDNGTVNTGALTCPSGTCAAGTIILNDGMSSTSGTAGNIRSFTGNGVNVKVSAFSRAKSNGAWSTAFLGAYGTAGLGVTDASEGTGSNNQHKVDNMGDRLNYMLFEFSKPVVVTKAWLDYIGADSDATIWVGNKSTDPYTNHLTLSDSLLASLGAQQSSTATSTEDRWASFNGDAVAVNVVVIAADVNDTTPEDEFKVAKIDVTCASAAVNHAPTLTLANRTNYKNAAINVQITGDDEDDDALTYSATGLPTGLTMNSVGLITGTATTVGTYNVTVTVKDGSNATASATFVWAVTNRAPTVSAANRTDYRGASVSVQIAGSDADGDALTYSATGLPTGLSMNAAGLITGTATTLGTYSVTVTVKDSSNATATATFTWTIVNRPPTVTASNRVDNKGTAVNFQIAGSDPDGDALTYSATGLPPGASISTTGKITGTLTTAGTYSVTVTVKDPSNATASATFSWTVKAPNVAPDAKNDSVTTTKNTKKTLTVLSNDTDANTGDVLTVTSVTQPSKGTVTHNSNGTLTFTPKANFVGTTTFTYTISDGNGGTDTATVTVTVGSHSDNDGCNGDHNHDGHSNDDYDHRERDCDRDHQHTRDCDHDRSHR